MQQNILDVGGMKLTKNITKIFKEIEWIKEISEGTYSLDHQIRDFIRTELS
jgi:hypothetical protein